MALASILLCLLVAAPLHAQAPPAAAPAGRIAGVVLDATTGEPIIEAGVEVIGIGKRARTDLDGKFSLSVPAGSYQVRFFAPLYQGARIERVEVRPNATSKADATLAPVGEGAVEVVEVVAKAREASEATQLLKRKKSPVVSDNIGAETIKKSPDSDAAEVVQRVPAVTIKDDKFIFVRGLGERYSSALLEGSRLPSTDPEKRVVPLDLFPANFVDSISIVKSYTPELPGDFAGGLADIRLLDFPDKLSFSLGTSAGGNTNATLQDFETYKGGGFDYFGFDQNVRSLPSIIPDDNFRAAPAGQRQAFGRAFKNVWETDTTTAPPNFGVNFSVGDTIGPVGMNLAGVYTTEYKFREQLERTFINAGSRNNPQIELGDDFDFDFNTFEVRLGGIFTAAYDIASNHRVTFRSLINRNTTDEVTRGEGIDRQVGHPQETSTLTYTQEELAYWQFAGRHHFSVVDVDWRTAFARTTQEIPDQRFTLTINGNFDNASNSGSRVFSDLTEYLSDSAVDFTIPFTTGVPFTTVWSGLPARVKFGPAYAIRSRDSELRTFKFNRTGSGCDLASDFEDLFSPENISPSRCFDFVDDTLPQNDFSATEEIAAGYGMIDLPLVKDRLRLVGGVRAEYSYIKLDTFSPSLNRPTEVIKNNTDPLPGVNLIYGVRNDMNVRFSYSQTVSRPEFRELSPAVVPATRGLRSLIGNPDLVQAEIESFDVRWEWFFSPSELVSVSFFYKELEQPIEQTVFVQGDAATDSFDNAEDGTLLGVEFEGRKHFGFITSALENLSLLTNVTWVDSEVNADQSQGGVTTQQTSTNRPLQGQADFVVNAALEYAHPKWGTARLLYNTIGERIAALGIDGLPDILEERRDQLDFVYLVKIAPFDTPLNLKLAVENILDDRYLFTQGGETQRLYETGRKITMGISYTY